ncbi:MAG: lipid II flippase MurJ [Terriglobales bacterium]
MSSAAEVSYSELPGRTEYGLRLTVQLSSLAGLQILFSFFIQAYTVLRLGAGLQTDALAAAYTIPQVAMILSSEVLSLVLVPVLAGRAESELKKNGWELFVGLGALFAILTGIIYVAVPVLIPLLVPGFNATGKQLAVTLARIQLFSLLGSVLYVVLTSLYQVRARFVFPAAALLISHVVGAAILVWQLPRFGITLVAWIQVLITAAPALLLLPVLGSIRHGSFSSSTVRQVLRNMRPLCLGAAYFKTSIVPDRIMGSFLVPGSIISLDLANRTCAAIERILNQGIVTPILPSLVTLRKSGDWAGFRRLYRYKLLEMFFTNSLIVVAIVLAYIAVVDTRVMGFVGHKLGRLGPEGVKTIALVFLYLTGRVLFSGPNHTLACVFYAAGDFTTPTKITAATYTVGLVAKVAGFFLFGLRGMALAISFTIFINFTALLWRLHTRHVDEIDTSRAVPSPHGFSVIAHLARTAQKVARASIEFVTGY